MKKKKSNTRFPQITATGCIRKAGKSEDYKVQSYKNKLNKNSLLTPIWMLKYRKHSDTRKDAVIILKLEKVHFTAE